MLGAGALGDSLPPLPSLSYRRAPSTERSASSVSWLTSLMVASARTARSSAPPEPSVPSTWNRVVAAWTLISEMFCARTSWTSLAILSRSSVT